MGMNRPLWRLLTVLALFLPMTTGSASPADAPQETLPPLHIAARQNQVEALINLIRNGADLEVRNPQGQTALNQAFMAGAFEAARILLEAGANPNARGPYGQTPFHWAAEFGFDSFIPLLLDFGGDIEARNQDNHNKTPLHWAVQNGNLQFVKSLIKNGAHLEAETDQKFTPLHVAAGYGFNDIASFLLEKGANISARSKYNGTPFKRAAVYNDDPHLLSIFLDNGADINTQFTAEINDPEWIHGSTLLHYAAALGKHRILRHLLKHGANIDVVNKLRQTPLIFSIKHKDYTSARILLIFGADKTIKDNNGDTVFEYAIRTQKEEFIELLKNY